MIETENKQKHHKSPVMKKRKRHTKSLYMMARCNKNMSENDRKKILYHELDSFDNEVKIKNIHTQCKANIFRFTNYISSFIVIVAGAVIIGLEATSKCISIPTIVLAGLLTVTKALSEVFRWGPQGLFFKQSTIRLKRVRRQVSDMKLMIHQYTTDQLMNEIRHMRNEYDDIDFSTYKMSTGGTATFNTNDIEVTNDIDQIHLDQSSNFGTPSSNHISPIRSPSSPSTNNNLQKISPRYSLDRGQKFMVSPSSFNKTVKSPSQPQPFSESEFKDFKD
jgi:hypothetical protein